jgi:hypothetical protein
MLKAADRNTRHHSLPLHKSSPHDHIIAMRKILPFVLLSAMAACSFPETRWEKDGADEKLTAADLGYCRKAARDEAFATYPFPYGGYPFGSPFYGFRRPFYWDDNRSFAETRLAQFCMRSKGYELVTVTPPQTTAPAR